MNHRLEDSLRQVELGQAAIDKLIRDEDWLAVDAANAALEADLRRLFVLLDESQGREDREVLLSVISRLESVLQAHEQSAALIDELRNDASCELSSARRGRKAAGNYLDTAAWSS